MNRWPPKPPRGQRCDATVGWGSDLQGKPVIYRCPNAAVETLVTLRGVVREMWLCADCIPAFVQRGDAYRNPRIYGPRAEVSSNHLQGGQPSRAKAADDEPGQAEI